ncbi:hypothetical protein PG985_001508 [Apiospora marii]|uniref:uncharacterized protein n=1 Tax=Apiospora marii TaxID=335849 RepID=UPI00312E5BFF
MASADVFQSPPAKPPSAQHYSMISSSPELPSLAELAQRQTRRSAPLRSGSNAAPIPATALTSFTSAKDVLLQAPDVDVDAEQAARSPSPKPKPKTTRKRATKAKPTPEATAAPDETGEAIVITSSSPTDKPVKKSRAKKAETAQSTISSRVTKATTTSKSKAKKKTETVSRHFASTKDKEKKTTASPEESPQPVASDVQQSDPPVATVEAEVSAPPEVALPRRRDWTPPPAGGLDNTELLSSSSKAPASKEIFQNMCQDFARPGEKDPIAKPSAEIAEFLKKRKLNDLPANEQASGSTETSPTKPAAAKKKKKIRTITELAMAPYQLPDLSDGIVLTPGNTETLLKHFDVDGAVQAQADHQRIVMDFQEEKSKGKKKKAPAKPRKKKAGTAEDPILLSPNSAIKQASNVDFLFGTSSQLQSDEPAEVLRDLQAAIQASNRANDDDEDDDDKSGLWHKGARDVDGSLLIFKVVDSRDGVEPSRGSPSPALEASTTDNDFPDISKICASTSQAGPSSLTTTQTTQSQQAVPSSRTTLPSSEAPATMALPPPPPRPAPVPAAKSKRPDFTVFTDAQLSRKISSYGFKPMKRRTAMIALLEQCWDEQQPADAVPAAPSISDSSTKAAPASAPPETAVSPAKKSRGRPKKDAAATASASTSTAPPAAPASVAPKSPKRGRPRKDSGSQSPIKAPKVTTPVRGRAKPASSKATKKVVEIADSDEEEEALSVSAGRSSPDPVFSSPPPLDLSISEDAAEADLSLNLSPTDQEASLFTYITKAVTTAPRSTDPQHPSWHELMLMYTPVILEDLAGWLNAGALTRVGYDAEVSALQVKRWCESKSVICLWRANSKGGTRKRY